MELYILRHAIAVERGTKGYEDDSKRPLTEEGIAKMRHNALGLKALGLQFDIILSSPYTRAWATGEIVTRTFKMGDVIKITNNLIPGTAFKSLIEEINLESMDGKSILLIGHEPHLSELISYLIAGNKNVPISMKKGGLCYLTSKQPLKAGSAILNSLLTPCQLRKFIVK